MRQRVHAAIAHANRAGGRGRVLAQSGIDDERVRAGGHGITVGESEWPAHVDLPMPGTGIDHERARGADRSGDHPRRLGDGEADRDRSLAADEAGAVDPQLAHDQDLTKRHLERAVRLGGGPVGIELPLRVDQHYLLKHVHRLEDRVQRGVGEPHELVRAGALGPGEPLAQCGLGERHDLAILEVVVSLLRTAQRGILRLLGPERAGQGEACEQHRGGDAPGHAAHSGRRV